MTMSTGSRIAVCAAAACVAVSAALCFCAWREVRDVYRQLHRFDD